MKHRDAERSANATSSLSRSKKSKMKQCEVRGNPYETQSHEHTGHGASATSGRQSPPFEPLGLVRRTDQNSIENSIEKAIQKSVKITQKFAESFEKSTKNLSWKVLGRVLEALAGHT